VVPGLASSDVEVSAPDFPAALRLLRVNLPLHNQHRTVHGVEKIRDVILVSWHRQDGAVGWGECPTLSSTGYATETTTAAWKGLTTQLGPAMMMGRSVHAPGLIASTAALMDAYLDARLVSLGRSLADELLSVAEATVAAAVPHDREPARALQRCVVIAELGASLDRLTDLAKAAVDSGAAMVKLKIAPGCDVEELLAVQAAIDDLPLAADANGSYTDLDGLAAVDSLGLAFIEQPFSADLTVDELARLRSGMHTPLALDESLTSLDAVRSAVLSGAVDVVSVKPARLGGMMAAASAVEFASSAGLGVFVGGMLELGIGRAGAAAVAALPGCNLPTDLGPSSQYVQNDICLPISVNSSGQLLVPTGPGIGRVPDEDQVQRYCVDELLL